MSNLGIFPLDPLTKVGQFRLAYGDIEAVELEPPVLGYGDYTELSDAEIETFLAQGQDSVNRAIGYYYVRLSGESAKTSKLTKDYDLSVDLTKRAEDLRKTAQMYFELADADDIAAGVVDIFDSFRFRGDVRHLPPEAAPPVV